MIIQSFVVKNRIIIIKPYGGERVGRDPLHLRNYNAGRRLGQRPSAKDVSTHPGWSATGLLLSLAF